MDITKIAVASVALVLSGWSLYEANASAQTLQRPEVTHRSAAAELRRMQAHPEEPTVLYAPAGDPGEIAPQPLVPARRAHPKAMRASAAGVEK
jgi:hypothetical protein